MTKIDCLICHDTTKTYKKAPTTAGMPDPRVDLLTVAKSVGKPSRKTCGDCHFKGGGGDAVKHGDMSTELYYPSRNIDIHMGGFDFNCQDCHKTRNHKIYGRSSSVSVAEGSRSCEYCHTQNPHYGKSLLSQHLNRHSQHLDCNTCHISLYSKGRPTRTFWDWSTAGDKNRKPEKDKYGMTDYSFKKGDARWGKDLKPQYAWHNGYMKRYLLGDKLDLDSVLKITMPVGDIRDQKSRISPFKIMLGRQPADAINKYLLVPHLFGPGGYWKTLDWQKSFEDGMKAVSLPYSNQYTWVDTEMYWRIEHEVTPKELALSCVQCHSSLKEEKSCNRCHQDNRDVDFKKLSHRGLEFQKNYYQNPAILRVIDTTDYLNFKKLGYKGDPIIYGGRFKKLPLGLKAEK